MANELQNLTNSADRIVPRFLSSVSLNAKTLSPTLRPSAELALAEARNRLRSATGKQYGNALTPCLSLVAPTGMTEADREDWLRAAWQTLDGIPADLLEIGCAHARKVCDHPAKVVPAILSAIDELWAKRKRDLSDVEAALAKMIEPPAAPVERCTPEQARAILEAEGIKLEAEKRDTSHRGPPIAPDAEWYAAHGIDITQEEAA